MTSHIGRKIGSYRLLRLLGRGGFASVYLCEHIHLKDLAVIKALHEPLTSDQVSRFLFEACIVSQLDHPHILRVLDFGAEDNVPFLVMTYASNGSMRQRYPRGTRVPLAEIVFSVQQVSRALQYSHDRGILHCDIKPENLLLGSNDEVLVSDLGVALDAQRASHQNSQELVGVLSYMAPEQIHGKPGPASDQYALGIVVYEWLSGELPFQGSYTSVYDQQMFAGPPSLCKKIPALFPAVEAVVLKALAKDAQERFESVNAFATALAHACASELPTMIEHFPGVSLRPSVPFNTTEKPSPPPISSRSAWLATRHLSRRTVLVGLLTCVVAGGGITAFVVAHIAGERPSNLSFPGFAGAPVAASSTSLHFTEVVAFRGDFGGNEPVNPKGLAYHPTLDKILITLSPYTTLNGRRVQILNAVTSDGARSRFAPGYAAFRDVESLLSIVPTNGPPVGHGFTPGDIFVGRGPGDEISRLSSSGDVLSDVWANPGTGEGLWGGLAFDTVGSFGGRLLVATMKGKVFAIDANGSSTLLKDVGQDIGRGVKQRLEGIVVAPVGFGPYAGKLLLGVEGVDDNDPQSGKIYALSNAGEVTLLTDIGYAAECITFVPPDGGTYYQAELSFDQERENRLLVASASQFLNRLGHMIVVNEYTGELWESTWTGSHYSTERIGRAPDRWSTEGISKQGTELEAGAFAVRPPTLPSWTNWSPVPGDLATPLALSASADINGDLHLLTVNNNDHHAYINTLSGLSRTWTGWQEIASGGLSTNYPLASVLHDNIVYGFATRDDGAVMYNRLFINGGPLSSEPWAELPGGLRTDAAVTATVANGRLVLCAKGLDQRLYLNELEPGGRASWSGWYTLPGRHASGGCALATFQDELYLFMNDVASGNIFVRAQLGNGQWTDWADVPGGGKTNIAVTAINASGQLYLFARGGDHVLYWNVASSTGTWSLWHPFPNDSTTDGTLTGAVINTRIYLAGKGAHDNRFYVGHSLP